MSAIDLEPPSTRFDSGHETNASLRSTITTSIAGSHMRMYLAAVAPPKPPPSTTTRAFPEVVAQPARNGTEASAAAPPILMKSRRSKVLVMALPYFFCAEKYPEIGRAH